MQLLSSVARRRRGGGGGCAGLRSTIPALRASAQPLDCVSGGSSPAQSGGGGPGAAEGLGGPSWGLRVAGAASVRVTLDLGEVA